MSWRMEERFGQRERIIFRVACKRRGVRGSCSPQDHGDEVCLCSRLWRVKGHSTQHLRERLRGKGEGKDRMGKGTGVSRGGRKEGGVWSLIHVQHMMCVLPHVERVP